jgi:hypothetical protein
MPDPSLWYSGAWFHVRDRRSAAALLDAESPLLQ